VNSTRNEGWKKGNDETGKRQRTLPVSRGKGTLNYVFKGHQHNAKGRGSPLITFVTIFQIPQQLQLGWKERYERAVKLAAEHSSLRGY